MSLRDREEVNATGRRSVVEDDHFCILRWVPTELARPGSSEGLPGKRKCLTSWTTLNPSDLVVTPQKMQPSTTLLLLVSGLSETTASGVTFPAGRLWSGARPGSESCASDRRRCLAS